MAWTNYHSHSIFCDGKYAPDVYIPEALQRNFMAYGFSSHAPVPFACEWCMSEDKLPVYLQTVQALKEQWQKRIQIYSGLEIDYIPGVINPATCMKDHNLDYCVGSVHFVEQTSKGVRWEIDGPHKPFLEGLRTIFKNDIRKAIERYYELIRQMVVEATPSVVGHLDKIKIQNQSSQLFNEAADWYKEAVYETLEAIKMQKGLVLEVNTRGLYKKKAEETYPSRWILEKALELNIPLTVQSDAHHPEEMDGYFVETATMLADIGFQTLHILWDGKWQPRSFTPQGIVAFPE